MEDASLYPILFEYILKDSQRSIPKAYLYLSPDEQSINYKKMTTDYSSVGRSKSWWVIFEIFLRLLKYYIFSFMYSLREIYFIFYKVFSRAYT